MELAAAPCAPGAGSQETSRLLSRTFRSKFKFFSPVMPSLQASANCPGAQENRVVTGVVQRHTAVFNPRTSRIRPKSFLAL